MSKRSGRSRRVTWDKAMDELGAVLSDKVEDVNEGVEKAVEKTAKKTAKDLRETNAYLYTGHGVRRKARRFRGNMREPGTYKKNFDQKKMSTASKSKSDFRRIVYVKSPEYRLSHLLEHGHRIVNKKGQAIGHAKPVLHFAPAEEQAKKDLLQFAQQEIKTSLGSPIE